MSRCWQKFTFNCVFIDIRSKRPSEVVNYNRKHSLIAIRLAIQMCPRNSNNYSKNNLFLRKTKKKVRILATLSLSQQ